MNVDFTPYKAEGAALRRHLHRIPEAGFSEIKTQAFIMDYLKKMGYVPQPIIKTGVVLYIPGNGAMDETIAFRADMDGLAGKEETGVDYTSTHPGMFHGCGHDGHMTILLLLAKFLADHPGCCPRNLLLLFQPAEEGPGGAEPMVKSGILEKYAICGIFGFHLFPYISEGVVATSPGPIIAMNSEIYIEVHGKGGHAANPDQCVDAIVAAAHLVTGLETIVSRNLNPLDEALLAIGTINGGTRMNVVADRVSLTGTMRSYRETIHKKVQNRILDMARGVEMMYHCTVDVKFIDMYPPVINDDYLYERVWPLLGEAAQKEAFTKQMIAEDFAFYGKAVPALFMGLGSKNEEKGFTNGLHSVNFNFDEDVLVRGLDVFLRIAWGPKAYKQKTGE